MTPELIIQRLGLKPHPEGGYYTETYRAPESIPAPALPSRYSGERALSTAIYYLLTPGTFSSLHRLQSDEIFHFYLGDPVDMLRLKPDGSSVTLTLGADLANGELPQVVVPAGDWQGARLKPGGRFALLGCTVAPGFDFTDFETGKRDALLSLYPSHTALITTLTHPQSIDTKP
jgi:predicted cupin superfamily sugar epimerase